MIGWNKPFRSLEAGEEEISEKPAFMSLPRKRESRKAVKILDSCFRRNDKIMSRRPFSEISRILLDKKTKGDKR
jgi:hypothetical protein